MPDEELAVRSEKPSLHSLRDTIQIVGACHNVDELANLLTIAAELYADARCRCEEKEVSFGEGDEGVVVCDRDVGKARHEMREMFLNLAKRLKEE